jgi:hypothetical protein
MDDGTPTDCTLTIYSVTDGDTVRMFRRWVASRLSYAVGDGLMLDEVQELYDDAAQAPTGVAARLCFVDTPERGQDGYKAATQDLADWLAAHAYGLRGLVYQHGGFDRMLVDIYAGGNIGDTASQFMLTLANNGAGWPPYIEGV